MIKKLLYGILIFSSVMLISGCGKDNEINTDSSSGQISVQTEPETTEQSNNQDETESPSESPLTETNKPIEEPEEEIKTEELFIEQVYSSTHHSVKILGLKEYKKLEEEKYTDKPSKGKKYLVLFLSIKNTGTEDDYINANYVHGEVDGTEIEHTFLVNSPRNYPPVFKHITAGSTIKGFIVWEVPKNWKKLVFYYDGWQYTDEIFLKCTLKKKDLFNPPIYSGTNLNISQ